MPNQHQKMPEVIDRRMPAADQCVLRDLLLHQAAVRPQHDAVVFESGETWSYAELLDKVSVVGRKLQDLGVSQGDTVLVWMPNGPDCLTAWYAVNFIGAIYVPINTAYRGRLLEHVIFNSGAKIALVHPGLIERLREISHAALRIVATFSGAVEEVPGLEAVCFDGMQSAGPVLPLERPICLWDTQSIVYTSGTTGPSKGVLISYLQTFATAQPQIFITQSDRVLAALPLFHTGGTIACYVPLLKGGTVVLVNTFSTDNFWPIVNRYGVTQASLLGVMCAFLAKRPLSGDEAGGKLRSIISIPLTQESIEFGKRFSLDVYSLFNMTETSLPLVTAANPTVAGTCGKPRAGVEVRIVDDNDCEVKSGEVGELVIRTDCPWEITKGYNNNAEATAEAWRNGWFHTGDAFRIGENGDYFFVDRIKDAIRRRGENISSYEVEMEVCAHPLVRESAAIAVPSDQSEDEVLIAISLVPGGALAPADLISFLVPRVPHFMVPRYVRTLPELPKTPTHKVMKHALRTEGITGDTWDRVQHGIVVRREKFETRSG
jgi:crotonobetaine/carnitine-CoA ligase